MRKQPYLWALVHNPWLSKAKKVPDTCLLLDSVRYSYICIIILTFGSN